VESSAPKGFEAAVWSRIAAREESRSDSLRMFLRRMFVALSQRPACAGAVAALAILMSLVTAHFTAEAVTARHFREGQFAYLESISPLVRANAGSITSTARGEP